MSGGVDSSVAAGVLRAQGYEVLGLFMRTGIAQPETPSCGTQRTHRGCCSAADAADARTVAGRLGIPFYSLNFERDFDRIINYFADEYASGRTPNPCVICNNDLKFGRLIEYADAAGAQYVATGHYARVVTRNGTRRLCKGKDQAKDQSYVLAGIDRSVLDRLLLPIGGMTKDQVRQEASRLGLPVSDKPDSMEICFVPDGDYAKLVRACRPEAFQPGDVVDHSGKLLGRHEGLPNFTIGQRRGLRIAAGHPIYVTGLNVGDNTVTVGPREQVLQRRFTAGNLNFLADVPGQVFRADVKIRYLHRAARADVQLTDDGQAVVTFDEPQSAITPGQLAAFYDGGAVLGAGWIEEVGRPRSA
jgi:tRNA-specific 2-thiouridylase